MNAKNLVVGIGKLALAIAESSVPAIKQIEDIVRALPGLKGKQKQDAVVNLVKDAVYAAEGVTDKDLVNDLDVETATRAVVDAVVALDNVIKRKQAVAPQP